MFDFMKKRQTEKAQKEAITGKVNMVKAMSELENLGVCIDQPQLRDLVISGHTPMDPPYRRGALIGMLRLIGLGIVDESGNREYWSKQLYAFQQSEDCSLDFADILTHVATQFMPDVRIKQIQQTLNEDDIIQLSFVVNDHQHSFDMVEGGDILGEQFIPCMEEELCKEDLAWKLHELPCLMENNIVTYTLFWGEDALANTLSKIHEGVY